MKHFKRFTFLLYVTINITLCNCQCETTKSIMASNQVMKTTSVRNIDIWIRPEASFQWIKFDMSHFSMHLINSELTVNEWNHISYQISYYLSSRCFLQIFLNDTEQLSNYGNCDWDKISTAISVSGESEISFDCDPTRVMSPPVGLVAVIAWGTIGFLLIAVLLSQVWTCMQFKKMGQDLRRIQQQNGDQQYQEGHNSKDHYLDIQDDSELIQS